MIQNDFLVKVKKELCKYQNIPKDFCDYMIEVNRFPRLYRRGTFKTQALLVLFLPLLVIGRIFGLLLRLFLP